MRDRTLWALHLLAGLVLFLGLGLHMAIMHLDATLGWFGLAGVHPVEWASVIARTKAIGFAVGYVVMLGAALFHGFYGLRNILRELGPGPRLAKAIDAVLTVGGVALFVFGAWVAIQAQALAQAASAAVGG
ncbi:MAG: hypothetical protein QM767_30670 [Anaeromyxobacter sp.]